MTPNIADIIRHHVTLEVRCIDRQYLHAYMPKLQASGGLCYFLRDYLGNPIPSPALFKPIHDRFVTAVEQFVARHAIPVVHFESGQDKDAIATAHRAHFTAREGVIMLGIAPENEHAPIYGHQLRSEGRVLLHQTVHTHPSTTLARATPRGRPIPARAPCRARRPRSRNPQAARGGRTCCLKHLLQP